MVLSQIQHLATTEMWQNIHEIWFNVMTQKGNQNAGNYETEYDIVIVTKFGTLMLLESKSAKFENKVSKGQEMDVFQKSGPYGRAIIIGPLLKAIKQIQDSLQRKKTFPYVAESLVNQAQKVENTGLQYWCFDEITEKLEKLLK